MKYWSFILIIILFSCNSKPAFPEVKKSLLAGTWYSSDPKELELTIDKLINSSKKQTKSNTNAPILLILPHAGYVYSGEVAAAGYNSIQDLNPDIIVIIGPSHYSRFHGCSILPVDYYETPLGKIKVDKDCAKSLLSNKLFKTDAYAHKNEHSVEIHIPFLQRIYKKIKDELLILPILVGDINEDDAVSISKALVSSIKNKKRPLFIISSDFTHYGPRFGYQPFKDKNKNIISKKLKELDFGAIDLILKKDMKQFSRYIEKTGATICGRDPIMIALAMPISNFKAETIAYNTSGNITGDYNNIVSYAAIAFSGSIAKEKIQEFNLSDNDKSFLLKIARKNIKNILYNNKKIDISLDDVPANCKIKSGVFVTLKKNGHLRGCIGYVLGVQPLYEAVIENSYNAAFKDPRFSSLKKEELHDIKIEISVLTKPQLLSSIDEIKVGRDGLIIEKGFYKGLLLPQVPVELEWNRNEFLINTCIKAGLPGNAWKDKETKIYTFQAIVFGE